MLRRMTVIAISLVLIISVSNDAEAKKDSDIIYGAHAVLIESKSSCSMQRIAVLSSIAAAILPKIVDHGLDFVTELLKERASRYEAVYSAAVAEVFFRQCERGDNARVIPRFSGIEFGYGPVSGSGVPSNEGYERLGFTNNGRSYFRGRFQYQVEAGRWAMRIVPEAFEFNQPVAQRGKTKDVVFIFSLHFPTAVTDEGKPDGVNVSILLPAFENVSPGIAISVNKLTSAWVAVPSVDKKILAEENDNVQPFSILTTVKETDKGHGAKLVLLLAQSIADNKADIAGAILGKQSEE